MHAVLAASHEAGAVAVAGLCLRNFMGEATVQDASTVFDRYVFVYGTLRRGELRDINRLTPSPVWLGDATVKGVLYDFGAYPGVVLGAPESTALVWGEVYAITAALEQQLDAIEEVWPEETAEYIKCRVQVAPGGSAGDEFSARSQAGQHVDCLIYAGAASRVLGRPVIEGGDWVAFRSARSEE
ncbi:MAG: hypothetical protein JWP47_2810 [Polaromonas sp.]|nr:hypothetical protein [Polaromonas sp.]